MQIHEFIDLYFDVEGQQSLYEKAKAGEVQSVLDFVRFSVFKKVIDDDKIDKSKKIKTYIELMNLVELNIEQKAKENG
jgi:hypothetical protein